MFEIPKDKVKALIDKFIKFHNFKGEQIEILSKHIQDYSKEIQVVYNKNIEGTTSTTGKKENEDDEIDVIVIKQNY
jgi:hypothetical protein